MRHCSWTTSSQVSCGLPAQRVFMYHAKACLRESESTRREGPSYAALNPLAC